MKLFLDEISVTPHTDLFQDFILLCKDSESCEELMSDKRNTDSFL